MIDTETAMAIQERLIIGEYATGKIDGVPFKWLIVDKTTFSVTLQGPTNRLTVPVEYTDEYRKEIEMRVPVATGEAAKRGRPKKNTETGSAAPVDHPTAGTPQPNPYLPPGYNPPPGAVGNFNVGPQNLPASAAPPAPMAQQPAQQPAAPTAPAREVPIQQAQGAQDWVQQAIEEGLEDLAERFNVILESVRNEAVESAVPSKPTVQTCNDCVYCDKIEWKCSKFDCVPPMFVIVEASIKCGDFIAAGGDDGITDADIPF